jgi:DGQHR domain-containing protein
MAKKTRLQKIAEYIRKKEGIFPTSIVLNIESKYPLKFDQAPDMAGKNVVLGNLHLPNKYKTAWIIDGQHRLFAYSDLGESKTATLPVIAFVNLDTNLQAQMFVDINGEQVRVPKSLLSDLWADIHLHSDNPGEKLKALASRLARNLDEDKNSPLRDRIVREGGKRTDKRNITFTALTEELLRRKLLGSVSSRKAKIVTPGPLYLDDEEKTLIRAFEIISGYLSNYVNSNDRLARQWELGRGEGGFICTNGGIRVLLRILREILEHLEKKDNLAINKLTNKQLLDNILTYQKPVCEELANASIEKINSYRSNSSSEQGVKANTMAFLSEINEEFDKFEPEGLNQYIQSKDSPNNTRAYEIHSEIESKLLNFVIESLKRHFGSHLSEWWHKGVPTTVREPAMQKATLKGNYDHPEKNLDFIDFREIINKNLDLFGDTFTIDAKESDSKKKKLSWFVKVNDIRNIWAHPPSGSVSDDELAYLEKIRDELNTKLEDL